MKVKYYFFTKFVTKQKKYPQKSVSTGHFLTLTLVNMRKILVLVAVTLS